MYSFIFPVSIFSPRDRVAAGEVARGAKWRVTSAQIRFHLAAPQLPTSMSNTPSIVSAKSSPSSRLAHFLQREKVGRWRRVSDPLQAGRQAGRRKMEGALLRRAPKQNQLGRRRRGGTRRKSTTCICRRRRRCTRCGRSSSILAEVCCSAGPTPQIW